MIWYLHDTRMNFPDLLHTDLITLLFKYLSNRSRISLLAAYPSVSQKVNWGVIHHHLYNPLRLKMRKIHDRYFNISKKERIDKMIEYYEKTDVNVYKTDEEKDKQDEKDYEIRNIPIVYSPEYKLEEYIYSITDYIYDDIRKYKIKNIKH